MKTRYVNTAVSIRNHKGIPFILKNNPAQRDSGNSILSGDTMRIMGSMGKGHKTKNSPAQRYSKMTNLVMGRMGTMGQRKPEMQNNPAQRDSKMTNLVMGRIGPMGRMGLMGRKPEMQNRLAQRDSGNSILKTSPYRRLAVRLVPLCGDPYRPLDFKNSPAQRDSGIYKLKKNQPVNVYNIFKDFGF